MFRACTHEVGRMLIWECGRVFPLGGVEPRSTSQRREQRTLPSFSSSLTEGVHGGSHLDLVGWGQAPSLNHSHWIQTIVLIHLGQSFQLVPSEDVSQLQKQWSTAPSLPYALTLGHQNMPWTQKLRLCPVDPHVVVNPSTMMYAIKLLLICER